MNNVFLSDVLKRKAINSGITEGILIEKIEYYKSENKLKLFLNISKNLSNEESKNLHNLLMKICNVELIEIEYNTIDGEVCGNKELIIKKIREYLNLDDSIIDNINIIEVQNTMQIHFPSEDIHKDFLQKGIKSRLEHELSRESNFEIISYHAPDKNIFFNELYQEELNITKETSGASEKSEKSGLFEFGRCSKKDTILIKDLENNYGDVCICGELFDINYRQLNNGDFWVMMSVSDSTESVLVKTFLKKDDYSSFYNSVSVGKSFKYYGTYSHDEYEHKNIINLKGIVETEKECRMDECAEKRVELNIHTQMSALDGINSFFDYAELAKKWGHKAIAITDNAVVQGFPEAMSASDKLGIKVLYGFQSYLLENNLNKASSERDFSEGFVVFDLETTGLSSVHDRITEIGAVKIIDGKIVETFSQLVNPEMIIPPKIVELTNITNEMVADKPKIEEVLPDFFKFIKSSALVAHNAEFDIGFLKNNFGRINMKLENPVIDTLELARILYPELKKYKLGAIAKHLNVLLVNAHRAVDDATATGEIFIEMLKKMELQEIVNYKQIIDFQKNTDVLKMKSYNSTIFAKNLDGLKDMYKIISASHIKYLKKDPLKNNMPIPRIPKSEIEDKRENLIIGSGGYEGELFQMFIKSYSEEDIERSAAWYDFLEIQPIGICKPYISEGVVHDEEQVKEINIKIVKLGEKLNKPVVATGDVHFLNPEDIIYRKILHASFRKGRLDDSFEPDSYFRTTDEMLEEFSYLGAEKAKEVVVYNSNLIADMIENFKPIPDGTYTPVLENSEQLLKDMCYEKAKSIYGETLPEIVEERLDRELSSIIKHGYAVLYIIAQKLVKKSNDDGFLVGSRGSVGSSFAATMSGITEVNPLPPHYYCPKCKYSEFYADGSVASGFDMPDKLCPKCGEQLHKDGHDIPFEVFLGFNGDKEPDIDLNFAGVYQSNAHKYTEELFGEGYVFRAGTIGTIKDKTAFGYVKNYYEERSIPISFLEINKKLKSLVGIKRTSGQHPGGVMIVPRYKEIYDFSPIQFPADDESSGVITTHFDYGAISGRILKLDILGHDTPTIIKELEGFTGVDSNYINFDDQKTLSIFTSTESLNIDKKICDVKVGSLGVPEFGTNFVRQMLIDTEPRKFSELVRISGLSHGTDVWMGNAQELVKSGKAKLGEVISTREDIMNYLINAGLDKSLSFKIMERVRKGKGLSDDDISALKDVVLPDWYIDSCQRISYMFPKAHAVAYVMMSFRIAFFKVYYPAAFYSTYFSTKIDDFNEEIILKGADSIRNKINEINSSGRGATQKDKDSQVVLEVAEEMLSRGLSFKSIDLMESDAFRFVPVDDKTIQVPFRALSGLGDSIAKTIVEEREKKFFSSVEDFKMRTKASKNVIELLKEHGCFKNISESSQLDLFSI